jgi:hypothetical protein
MPIKYQAWGEFSVLSFELKFVQLNDTQRFKKFGNFVATLVRLEPGDICCCNPIFPLNGIVKVVENSRNITPTESSVYLLNLFKITHGYSFLFFSKDADRVKPVA